MRDATSTTGTLQPMTEHAAQGKTAAMRRLLAQTHGRGLAVGDRFRLIPQPGNRWWTVRARDERFIVATQRAPFQPKGDLQYTVIDLNGWQDRTYNGAGNGIVRSSLNTLGGGYDVGADGEHCDQLLAGLRSGRWGLSHRRVLDVHDIETTPAGGPR